MTKNYENAGSDDSLRFWRQTKADEHSSVSSRAITADEMFQRIPLVYTNED